MVRRLKQEFSDLEKVQAFLQRKSDMSCSIEVDQWVDTIISAKNKCLLIKKSATAGAKIVMIEPTVVDIQPVPPSTFLNSFRRGISAIILNALLEPGQIKVANEVESWLLEIEQ
jgi:hypothetical protein